MGDERHRFPADPRGPPGGRTQRHGLQDLWKDDPHLEGSEAGTQAPPDAAAEGEPSESRRGLADEPGRPELGGALVEVLTQLGQGDVGTRDRSGGNRVPAKPDGPAPTPTPRGAAPP